MIFLINTLLLHIPLLALTDGQNYRELRIHSLLVGWKKLFPVVLLCQFFVLAGYRFWFYILLMLLDYHTVGVLSQFFLFWREIGVGVTYVLSVQYSCAAVSVFCCGRKANLVQIFLLNPRIFFSYISVSLFQRINLLAKIYFL